MKQVKPCRSCKWATEDKITSWSLACTHPNVNADNHYYLSSKLQEGSACSEERKGNWFSACGKRGALWKPVIA